MVCENRARMLAFEEVATAMFGRVLFLHIPSNMTNIMTYFGMTAEVNTGF